MRINNRWISPLGVALFVTAALTACSGNPVDETSAVSKSTVSAKIAVSKVTTLLGTSSVKKTVVVAVSDTSKPITRAESQAKKQSISTLAKPKEVEARLKHTQAKYRDKNLINQKSEKIAATRIQLENTSKVANTRSRQLIATRAPQPNIAIRKVAFNGSAKRPVISRITPSTSFGYALSNAAIERTKQRVRYDGKYVKIAYPWGDVPKSIGVCTDVVIRAYRKLGIDLQQEVHKDISQDFYAYPNLVKWGLRRPDPNIDHRRVYNLQAFFKRHKAELPRSKNPRDYKAGDLVTWMVGPSFPHIGVVVNKPSRADSKRLMIAHNIGSGPQIEDILFRFPITGHYRYTKQHLNIRPALLFAKTPPPAYVLQRQRNKGLSHAELLQAGKILLGSVQARAVSNRNYLLTKNSQRVKPKEKIMLAHFDASVFGNTIINHDALQALLK